MLKVIIVLVMVLVIVLGLVTVASVIAKIQFNRTVEKEVTELFAHNPSPTGDIITKADLQGLPPCVQKWLEHAQVVGKERIHTVRLKQRGLMRLKENGPWMQAEAEQYFTVDKPGFIWTVQVKMAPLLNFTGRDRYYKGKGVMLIKALSLFPVVKAQGKEMDQGTLLRYLAEMPWFPTAALNDYITWEPVDAHSARATMSYGGISASGVFTFNEQGDLVSFIAKRYRENNGKYELTDWGGIMKEYKEFQGIRIPNKSDIIWRLETGDFNWFKCEIADIQYNKPVMYER